MFLINFVFKFNLEKVVRTEKRNLQNTKNVNPKVL